MLVQRISPILEAVQYKTGVEHPFVTPQVDGSAMINLDHYGVNPEAAIFVSDGEWVVREAGVPDQVFSDAEFHNRFMQVDEPRSHTNTAMVGAAVDRQFANAEMGRVDAPLAVIISGWCHTGKTTISSFLEQHLIMAGFTNVKIDHPEQNPASREHLAHGIARSKDEPDSAGFFKKPITIYEALPPRGKRAVSSK